MNADRLPDTWYSREYPVLREAARIVDAEMYGGARFAQLQEATGLDMDDVTRASRALQDAGLVDVTWTIPPPGSRVTRISGEARQLVGMWPTAETALERIVSALEALARQPDHPARADANEALEAFKRGGAAFLPVAAAVVGQDPA